MNKTKAFIIFTIALIVPSPILAKVTIEPLDPAKGKVLLVYEVKCKKADVADFVYPLRGGLTSLDRKPILVSVVEKGSGEKLKAVVEPYTEGGRTIPGKYEFHISLPKPLQAGEKYALEIKTIIYNRPNCYDDKTGRWICEYSTQHNVTFLVPKGHIPVFSSHPVRIFEDGGKLCLQTDTGPAEKEQVFVFKTEPPPKQEGLSTPPDTNDLTTEANDL
jgi:hypothetical protein